MSAGRSAGESLRRGLGNADDADCTNGRGSLSARCERRRGTSRDLNFENDRTAAQVGIGAPGRPYWSFPGVVPEQERTAMNNDRLPGSTPRESLFIAVHPCSCTKACTATNAKSAKTSLPLKLSSVPPWLRGEGPVVPAEPHENQNGRPARHLTERPFTITAAATISRPRRAPAPSRPVPAPPGSAARAPATPPCASSSCRSRRSTCTPPAPR